MSAVVFGVQYFWIFVVTLLIVSFLYSSIGHGGASGYLALMAIFSFDPQVMKPTALLLNMFVAAISFYHYYREGYFDSRLFFCFAVTSIPMSFLGGMVQVEASLYKKILGVFLIFAILRMLNIFGKQDKTIVKIKVWGGMIVGAVIGFLSGLIGIGGGIILSPVILLLRWGRVKQAAAVSALFIWVNSVSGMMGQISSGINIYDKSLILVFIALIGGFLGGYMGSKKINYHQLKYLLITVLAVASFKLMIF